MSLEAAGGIRRQKRDGYEAVFVSYERQESSNYANEKFVLI